MCGISFNVLRPGRVRGASCCTLYTPQQQHIPSLLQLSPSLSFSLFLLPSRLLSPTFPPSLSLFLPLPHSLSLIGSLTISYFSLLVLLYLSFFLFSRVCRAPPPVPLQSVMCSQLCSSAVASCGPQEHVHTPTTEPQFRRTAEPQNHRTSEPQSQDLIVELNQVLIRTNTCRTTAICLLLTDMSETYRFSSSMLYNLVGVKMLLITHTNTTHTHTSRSLQSEATELLMVELKVN